MTLPLKLHRAATREFNRAADRYARANPVTARAFSEEVQACLRRIREAPAHAPLHMAGTRRLVLDRFPYSIIFVDRTASVFVVAIAHQRRRDGYWLRRVDE